MNIDFFALQITDFSGEDLTTIRQMSAALQIITHIMLADDFR